MIVCLSVVAFGLGGVVGYVQSTGRRPAVVLAMGGQLIAIVALVLVNQPQQRYWAWCLLGTLAGAAAAHLARRRAVVVPGD